MPGKLAMACCLLPAVFFCPPFALAGSLRDAEEVAARIDEFLGAQWQQRGVLPTEPADDAAFLRRAVLDLAGRVPSVEELDRFLADASPDSRVRLVRELVQSPEFPLHFGNVLDGMIQQDRAGRREFVQYLRDSLRDRKPWDRMFREMMIGPWKSEAVKPAAWFLAERARQLDVLTVDTTKAFFGVDISCAKCHDHPLVPDWSQEHFYGMASFLNRTYEVKRNSGLVGEKSKGEVTYNTLLEGEKTAQMMFLSGERVEEPDEAEKRKLAQQLSEQERKEKHRPVYSRREQLVEAALQDDVFFRRAIVNRLWAYFFGRGLVHPVDQLHSGNEPSVPGLLEWLADDFAENGYDLHRLATAIALTRAYGLSSRWTRSDPVPDAGDFVIFRLRPLTRRQLAFSLAMATGDGDFGLSADPDGRRERYLAIEKQTSGLLANFDPRRDGFQSSTTEAMFVSNHEAIQKLIQPADGNLTARLIALDDTEEMIALAYRTILSRSPEPGELEQVRSWIER